MVEKSESLTNEEEVLGILHEADKFTPDNGIKPSEFWKFREEVRAKYALPESGTRWENPVPYIREIEQLAKENGIDIRPKHEFSTYFKEKPDAGAVAFSPDVFRKATLVVKEFTEGYTDEDWFALRARANQLAHEIVHALQYIKYPSMPDDIGEYEAYAYQRFTPVDILRLKDDPEYIASIVNEEIPRAVSSSVNIANNSNNLNIATGRVN